MAFQPSLTIGIHSSVEAVESNLKSINRIISVLEVSRGSDVNSEQAVYTAVLPPSLISDIMMVFLRKSTETFSGSLFAYDSS